MDIYKHFDELVNLDLISIDELDKVYSKKRSILSYVAENYNENTLEMMKLRLDGKTLEEVGNATGVTRERVRQIVKKLPVVLIKLLKKMKMHIGFVTMI